MQTQNEYEEMCAAVHGMSLVTKMDVLIVPAEAADDLGHGGLQIVANRAGRNVVTEPGSKYHSGTIFRPQA